MRDANSLLVSIKGRILTRHHFANELHYYLRTPQGPVRVIVPHGERICFCRTQDLAALGTALQDTGVRQESLVLKTFDDEPVSALYFSSNQSFRHLSRTATDKGVALFESELRAEQRYLIERYIALDVEFVGQWQATEQGIPTLLADRGRRSDAKVSMSVVSLDFECSVEGELYSVGLFGQSASGERFQQVIMVGEAGQAEADYLEMVEDERALILRLLQWFKEHDPDIIIGWAVVTFDLALLYRRAKLLGIDLTLGRCGARLSWRVENKFRPETLVLPGRVVLDGIDWLKAAFYQFDSFSLENVARELLGEGKAIHNVSQRAEEITSLFLHDKVVLAHYNITDCRLVWEIFEKTSLLAFALERSRLTGLELGRVGASVAAFNNLYLPHLHRAGYVAPSAPVSDGIESPGGYVMDSKPGLYQHILVLDFKSLYPSIIRTFLIDPKGLIEGLKQGQDTVPGFLGAEFSRREPILPELIASLSAKRELAKQEANGPLSQAIKIIMNSLYGVLGSRGCVFHDARLASSITLRGHEIMKQTKQWIEEQGLTVIYGDTDSTFVHLAEPERVGDIDAFARKLVDSINQKWRAKLKQEYQLECYLELEYERHFEQFFMPTLRGSTLGSKKRYVGAYRTSEQELKLVFKGMEQVRSDWSPLAREIQAEIYYRLFAKLDVVAYLKQIISELQQGMLDDKLIFSKRLRRDIVDYTAKSSPHVKAATIWCERSGEKEHGKRGAKISYLMTQNGAEPVQYRVGKIDYQYYLDKQIAPISDPILSILNTSFNNLVDKQMTLI
ncbi:DNA polymerase II [Shewanella marisflavi]|uniref:DNA polymerase II n=1 Tax=Shewanella marisflavi TaxID=260364 RepID=UPI003AACC983